jgi:hypothetical protein
MQGLRGYGMWCCDERSLPYILKARWSFESLANHSPNKTLSHPRRRESATPLNSLGDVSEREQNISTIPVIRLNFTANTVIGRECVVSNLIVLVSPPGSPSPNYWRGRARFRTGGIALQFCHSTFGWLGLNPQDSCGIICVSVLHNFMHHMRNNNSILQ